MITHKRLGSTPLPHARPFYPSRGTPRLQRYRVCSDVPDLAALRQAAEANLEVTERFHPGLLFHLRSETILGAKNERAVRHFPDYILKAAKPNHFHPDKVLVSDVDGIFTDGAAGHFLHHFNNHCGRYAAFAKSRLLWTLATRKYDFATRNELAARINAGLTVAQIEKNAQDFFDHVLIRPHFNVIPVPDEDAPIDYPFINEEAVEHILNKKKDGWTIILASGSLRSIWQTVFKPANLKRYAQQYFTLQIPDEPLVDFIIGGSPKFNSDGIALSDAEKPLTIGDGKRLLVEKLLDLWGANRWTVQVQSDDVHADRFFLQLAEEGNRFAVNIPAADEPLARAFGHSIIRLDGLDADLRTPDHLQVIKTYRETIVEEAAVELLRSRPHGAK